MKKICIYGAGGFAHEVYWLALQCGYEVDAFIDIHPGEDYRGIPIKDDNYFNKNEHLAVVAVGNPKIREMIIKQIITRHGMAVFKTLVSPHANLMDPNITVGYGSVICANCVLTCDIQLGAFSQLNLSTTIGHDTVTGDFFTTAPGVHISGKVKTGEKVYFGTNASTVENINICDDVTIGAAACVSKDITESGIYVGVPAKKLEKKNG
ncbi:MAG TPA: NeuD/PglB/VioB family sugar acetyltransferase [Candidatus Saccharimonadales bacterium]